MGLKNGFRVVLRTRGAVELIQLPSLPVVAEESFSVLRFSHLARLLRERRRRGPAKAALAAAAARDHRASDLRREALAQKPHSLPPNNCTCAYCRARVRQPPRHKQNYGRHVKALGRGPTFC